MTKLILCTCLLIYSAKPSHCQTIFHKMYPGTSNESISRQMGFIETYDKGFLYGSVATLMKLDSMGSKEWRYEYDLPVNPLICVFSIVNDFNQGYILSGSRMLISLDSLGNKKWLKDLTSNFYFYIVESKKTDTLSFIHSGLAGTNNIETPCVFKSDSAGNIQWAKIYNSNPSVEWVSSMEVASDGSIYLCGVSRSVLNPTIVYYDGILLKLNSTGTIQWARRYSNVGTEFNFNRIKSTKDGNFIITGSRNFMPLLMKIDTSGSILWEKVYATGLGGNAIDVFCTFDNGYALVGEVSDTTMGGTAQTSIFIKTDSIGNQEWARYMGGFDNVSASKILQVQDNGFAIAGRRYVGNGYRMNLIRTDSLGNTDGCLETNTNVTISNYNDTIIDFILTDSIISITTVPYNSTFPLIGSEIDLCNFQGFTEHDFGAEFDVYPNPTFGTINIRFAKSLTPRATIRVFDLVGKKVHEMELIGGQEEYKVNFNPEKSGVFIIKLQIGEKFYFNKIIAFRD